MIMKGFCSVKSVYIALPTLGRRVDMLSDCCSGMTAVVSSRRTGAIAQTRSLYESILHLERKGLTVIERHMEHADMALSPSTCLCIFNHTYDPQVKGISE